MFEIDLYNEDVLRAFYEKREQEKLTHLQRATRGRLMNECLKRLENGELDRDLSDLIKIFGSDGTLENLKTVITRAGADKFRPLQDFFQQKTSKPTDNIITLIAIFIDFEPRPFSRWRELHRADTETVNVEKSPVKYIGESSEESAGKPKNEETPPDININSQPINLPEEENSLATEAEEKAESTNEQPNKEKDREDHNSESNIEIRSLFSNTDNFKTQKTPISPWKRKAYIAGASVLTAIAATTTYFSMPKDCMCWNGERYTAVDCHDKTQAYQIIGLNTEKLEHFQKITRSDTLSAKDIGKVWYSKINSEVEFFTTVGFGFHPEHRDRSLKSATANILEKYAGKNAQKTDIE